MNSLMELVKSVVKEDSNYVVYVHNDDSYVADIKAFTNEDETNEFIEKNLNKCGMHYIKFKVTHLENGGFEIDEVD